MSDNKTGRVEDGKQTEDEASKRQEKQKTRQAKEGIEGSETRQDKARLEARKKDQTEGTTTKLQQKTPHDRRRKKLKDADKAGLEARKEQKRRAHRQDSTTSDTT